MIVFFDGSGLVLACVRTVPDAFAVRRALRAAGISYGIWRPAGFPLAWKRSQDLV